MKKKLHVKLDSSVDCDALRIIFWEVSTKNSVEQEHVMFLSGGAVWMEPIIEFNNIGWLASSLVEAKYVKAREKVL